MATATSSDWARATGWSRVSDEDWQNILKDNDVTATRKKQAREQAIRNGETIFKWNDVGGRPYSEHIYPLAGASSSNTSASAGGLNNSSSSSNGDSLLSSLGLGDGNLLDTAKDMARFRLGLDKEQGEFSFGLRDREADANFGRNTKLAGQQITGQLDLEGLRQDATTARTDKQLQNNLDMLNTGNNFNLLVLGKNRAAALSGLR